MHNKRHRTWMKLGAGASAAQACESAGTVQGSKSPKSGKEGFGVKKLPFPIASEKGALSRKIPMSLQGSTRKMGIFRLRVPFSEAMGNGSFFTPKPSFPDFGDFDPCTVPALSQAQAELTQRAFPRNKAALSHQRPPHQKYPDDQQCKNLVYGSQKGVF